MDITGFIASKREDAILLGDYGAYRTKLSRRLATVRKKLGRVSAKGKKFAPALETSSEDVGNNHEFVHLQLLVSERAWAHAMHMRSVHAADPSQDRIQGSDRRHIISRFMKAYSNAEKLVRILHNQDVSKATDQDVLEAQAFAHSLAGATFFERQAWPETLSHYSTAHLIYTALEKSTKKDVFRDFRSSAIDPSLRYGAHMVSMPRIVTIPTIARKFFPRDEKIIVKAIEKLDPTILNEEEKTLSSRSDGELTDLPKEIVWRKRKVPLEDVSVATALASVNKKAQELGTFLNSPEGKAVLAKDRAAAYDDVLIPSQDAADAAKQAIDHLVGDGMSQGDNRMQALQITRTAVNYALVGWRIGRNRVLDGELEGDLDMSSTQTKKTSKKDKDEPEKLENKEPSTGRKLAKIRERVALYDATLQSLDSIKELPGVAADSQLVSELDATYCYFQAFKCFLLARSHAILSSLPNALALYARAESLCAKSVSVSPPQPLSSDSGPSDVPTLVVSPSSRQQLHKRLKTEVIRHRALVELATEKEKAISKAQSAPSKPLVENLNTFPESGLVDLDNLVVFPPKLRPIPIKPIFLDVAWNYIEYPGRSNAAINGASVAVADSTMTDATKQSEKPPAKRGWFGFGR